MPELQRLRADHALALLAFERENRAWFARTISDRGDAYFAEFPARHQALLTYQDEGTDHFHVLVADDGTTVLGRFNLLNITEGEAELGFRMAESATGQGLATQAAHAVCHLAATDYALTSLRAQADLDNLASHTVLTRVGFTVTGETVLRNGTAGRRYVKGLAGGAAGATGL
ncbi:GNAT family N-acetyltransferase [Streptomyces sp. KE1]|uniref:GNAT family N-acetyltransferase n=1 Tax=Streptomyces sp. KE1 TaxID=1638939 RepID=UPI00063EBE2C|nr:GNAT family N-acetyltransferase [Streptomyces sp. KE1]KLJ04558.1 GCN5 family acetyltransferase [Streptomyces sp. KE1]